MTDLKTALWCDLTTDAERSAWLLLGRGYETGVVAKAIQNDLARVYERLSQSESDAVAAEREACAKVCEEVGEHPSLTPRHCAEAIRARGQA